MKVTCKNFELFLKFLPLPPSLPPLPPSLPPPSLPPSLPPPSLPPSLPPPLPPSPTTQGQTLPPYEADASGQGSQRKDIPPSQNIREGTERDHRPLGQH